MGHARKKQATICLTTKCNMNCKYCLSSAYESKPVSIDINFAKRGVKDFFEMHNSYWIRFYGPGEPTLEFEKMCEIKKYAEEISGANKLFVELQSNGVFNNDIMEWISKNVDIVYLSMDGNPNLNDVYRTDKLGKNVSDIIIRNIKNLVNHCTVCIRSTITDVNVNRQKEIIDFFSGLGVSAIFSKPVLYPVKHSNRKMSYEVDLCTYAKNFVDAHLYAKNQGVLYSNIYISNFDEFVNCACRANTPCPHLTPDGYVSACDRAYEGNTQLQDFIYGKYIQDDDKILYFEDKIINLNNRKSENISACDECEISGNCGGSCLGTAYQYTGNMYGVIKEQCEVIKFFGKHIPKNQGLFPYHHP